MAMKVFLSTILFFATAVTSDVATANEVTDLMDQKVVLLNPVTIQEIETAFADSKLTVDQKAIAIKASLQRDAVAVDGYCPTAVKTWGQATGRPKPEKVAQACTIAFEDDDFMNGIATGEFMSEASTAGHDLRTALSRVFSGYILLMAMGPF